MILVQLLVIFLTYTDTEHGLAPVERSRVSPHDPGRVGPLSGRGVARVGALVKVAPEAPEGDGALVVAGEDVAGVDGEGVDGRVVRLHLAHQGARLGRPQLQEAGAAARHHRRRARQERQAAYPVLNE